MPSYRVSFINEIARGPCVFRCVQRSILIRSARDRDRAVAAAKQRFARLEGVRHWSHHAAAIEVEPAGQRRTKAGLALAAPAVLARSDASDPS